MGIFGSVYLHRAFHLACELFISRPMNRYPPQGMEVGRLVSWFEGRHVHYCILDKESHNRTKYLSSDCCFSMMVWLESVLGLNHEKYNVTLVLVCVNIWTLQWYGVKCIDHFIYLGSFIIHGGFIFDEILGCIGKSQLVFGNLRHLWSRRDVYLSSKRKV